MTGIGHFDIVAENVVEGYLQRWYASGCDFALLYAQQIVLALIRDFAQFVEFGVDTRAYD